MKPSTKEVALVLFLGGLLAVLPLIAQNGGAKNVPVSARAKQAFPLSALDREAAHVAKAYWDSILTKCGQYYVGFGAAAGNETYLDAQGRLRLRTPSHNTDIVGLPGLIEVVEYGADLFASTKIYTEKLDEADRMNGVEWIGGAAVTHPVILRGRSAMMFSKSDPPNWKPWTSWQELRNTINPDNEDHLHLGMKKEHGQWFINGFLFDPSTGPAIESCSVKSIFLPPLD